MKCAEYNFYKYCNLSAYLFVMIIKGILKFSSVFLLLLFSINIRAQELIKNYVKNNTVQILTIEPDSADYADLKSIGDAIGDAKIVMLGEQYHGDATTFLAKSRLVKYLHEKKGFNVLAFESDFYALNEGWDKLSKTKIGIDSFMYKNPFEIWGYCNTCSNLFYTYIAKTFETATPLQISGFDCQLHGGYTRKNFINDFKLYINKPGFADYAINNQLKFVLPLFDSMIMPNYPKSSITCDTLLHHLQLFYNQISVDANTDKFWLQVIKSLMAYEIQIKAELEKATNLYHIRDMQMADNIDWLCKNKYPGEKIIVWAHNAHISKNSGDIFNFRTADNNMMGSYINRNPGLKDKIYSIGFTSFKGSTQWVTNAQLHMKLQKPYKNSFENWINKKYNYAFVDFKKFKEINPSSMEAFSMKGSTYKPHYNYTFSWTNVFDGIFFIREMYGCKNINEK